MSSSTFRLPAVAPDGPEPGLRALDPAACRALLAAGGTGRIVFTRGALPEVCPVAFAAHRGLIGFATDDADVARAVLDNVVAAFEIDAHDPVTGSAWAVLAVGRTSEITAAADLARIRSHLAGPWRAAAGTRVLALRPERLRGWHREAGPRVGIGEP